MRDVPGADSICCDHTARSVGFAYVRADTRTSAVHPTGFSVEETTIF